MPWSKEKPHSMRLSVLKSCLSGSVEIPGSKSHTVRAVAIGSLASGKSIIRKPLIAADTLSAVNAYRALGAEIETNEREWIVRGFGGAPKEPHGLIDVGNSGTTLYIAAGSAALGEYTYQFTGDAQIARRPSGPLAEALVKLGAKAETRSPNGVGPLTVTGPIKGGSVRLDCSKTSQYLSSLLMNCPLATGTTLIEAENLVEQPYVEMTLRWTREQGIEVENDDFQKFTVPGGQQYQPFDRAIPADWSSATFFLCAAAVTGSTISLNGLDIDDTQGDKAIADILLKMGADIDIRPESLTITGGNLTGGVFDLKDTPDALPALAVTACFAKGETRLVNVAQARLKETDRIAVMCKELKKMGADIEELPDGLVIYGSKLYAADVCGHDDHRVIMALTIAAMGIDGESTISPADALDVTFPTFVDLMNSLGADIITHE